MSFQPHFFIPGGQRAGSTTLAVLLDEHPQIFMAKPLLPEPKYFLAGENRDSYEEYVNKFFLNARNYQVRGEKSVSYMDREEGLLRIAKVLPEAKMIVVIRNPVERAVSHYRYSRHHKLETLDFSEAVRKEAARIINLKDYNVSAQPFAYLERGKYINAIKRICNHFSQEDLLVVLLEDLMRDPYGICAQIFRFLNVDPDFSPPSLGKKINKAKDPMDFEIDEDTLGYMKDILRQPTIELQNLLGRDLSIWGLW